MATGYESLSGQKIVGQLFARICARVARRVYFVRKFMSNNVFVIAYFAAITSISELSARI